MRYDLKEGTAISFLVLPLLILSSVPLHKVDQLLCLSSFLLFINLPFPFMISAAKVYLALLVASACASPVATPPAYRFYQRAVKNGTEPINSSQNITTRKFAPLGAPDSLLKNFAQPHLMVE